MQPIRPTEGGNSSAGPMASIELNSGFGKAPAIDLPAVFFFVGVIVCAFGVAMLLPALVDLADGNDDYRGVPDAARRSSCSSG